MVDVPLRAARAARQRLAASPKLADRIMLGLAGGCVVATVVAHLCGWPS